MFLVGKFFSKGKGTPPVAGCLFYLSMVLRELELSDEYKNAGHKKIISINL
jgi:hypothetical protein